LSKIQIKNFYIKSMSKLANRSQKTTTKNEDSPLQTFYQVATHALIRAELAGKVPERFSGQGPLRWRQFANELNQADLLDLAIQDASIAYPIPFGLRSELPGYQNGNIGLDLEFVDEWIQGALSLPDQPSGVYLKEQADRLEISLPSEDRLEGLPSPESHHNLMELPGTGGWLAYQVIQDRSTEIYFWENFTVAGSSWQEVMLAGLIAFELDAPPNKPLFIYQDESLRILMDENRRYDWVIGSKSHNAHRALELFVNKKDRIVLV
jgi:hypothetical protein